MVRPLVEKAALVQAINDAWLVIGALTVLALLLLLLVRHIRPKIGIGIVTEEIAAICS